MDAEKELGYAWEEWNAMDAQVRAAARAVNLVEDIRRVQEKAGLQEMGAFIGHKGLGDEFVEWALAQRDEIDRLLAPGVAKRHGQVTHCPHGIRFTMHCKECAFEGYCSCLECGRDAN